MKKSKIKQEKDGSYTISVNVKLEGSMLKMEESIQEVVNEIGLNTTLLALKQFDTDGEPIAIKGEKYTSKGLVKKSTKRRME